MLTLPSELQALFVKLLADATTAGRLAGTSRAVRQLVKQRLVEQTSFVTWRSRLAGKPFGSAVLIDALHVTLHDARIWLALPRWRLVLKCSLSAWLSTLATSSPSSTASFGVAFACATSAQASKPARCTASLLGTS